MSRFFRVSFNAVVVLNEEEGISVNMEVKASGSPYQPEIVFHRFYSTDLGRDIFPEEISDKEFEKLCKKAYKKVCKENERNSRELYDVSFKHRRK